MLITIFICALPAAPPAVHRQSAPSAQGIAARLEQRYGPIEIEHQTFAAALLKVAAALEIPMGIELLNESCEPATVHMSLPPMSGREIIATLVKTQPAYDWEQAGAVVHVFPRGAPTDRKDPLNIRLDTFAVEDEYIAVASRKLQERVAACMSKPEKLRLGGEAGSIGTGLGDRRTSFVLRNASARDILDRLLLSADFRVWLIIRTHDALTPRGYYHTASPFSPEPAPLSEQPVWSFLPSDQRAGRCSQAL